MKFLVDPETPRRADEAQFELDDWVDCAPFESLLGLHIEKAEEGEAHLTLPYTVKLANGGGVMHGGALATLADTAVAMAIKSLLPSGTAFATTELSMEFVAPVLAGRVSAHARVRGPDGRVFQGECELRGEQDQLYARFRSVFKVVRSRQTPANAAQGQSTADSG